MNLLKSIFILIVLMIALLVSYSASAHQGKADQKKMKSAIPILHEQNDSDLYSCKIEVQGKQGECFSQKLFLTL